MTKLALTHGPGRDRAKQRRPVLTATATLAAASATALALGPGATAASATPTNPPIGATADCNSVASCFTPRQIEVAYGIAPLLDRGIDGAGETVVVPELAETQLSPPAVSDLRRDIADFDRLFGLPAPHLRVVSAFKGPVSPWLAFGEEVLDVEMVHAVAPAAAITVVLVDNSLDNPASAVAASVASLRSGLTQGGVISISAAGQTGGEHCDTPSEVSQLNAALQSAADHNVTVVAASGDIGAVGEPCAVIEGLTGGNFPPVKGVNLPASDPLVLAAGGTNLTASHKSGAYIGESAWGLPFGDPGSQFQASGGGFSRLFARPVYQDGVPGIGTWRGVPDVAADASPHQSMAVVIDTGGGHYMVRSGGGTSASAPLWAGVIALADQNAGRHLGVVNAAIYQIAKSANYHKAFHDIVDGVNAPVFPGETITGYKAAAGWDPVTGWGSPDANVLVPLLARYDSH
jgi:subtilase family serine protease